MKSGRKLALGIATMLMGSCLFVGLSNLQVNADAAETTIPTESLLVAGENVSFSTAQHYNYVGGALESGAMLATASGNTGTVTTKLIDLSTLTKDDYIFRWRPYSPVKDTQGVTITTVKLIDAEDPTNYIQLNYTPNMNMTYNSNSLGAVSQWIYKNISGEYVATGGVYEYGALMGTVNQIAYQMGNFGGFGGVDITGDGAPEGWIGWGTGHIVQFSLAYENGMLYTPRKVWGTNNADFQNWVGFSGTEVYAELSWTNVSAGNGLAIDTIAGLDVTGTTVEKATPAFSTVKDFVVDINTETDIPKVNAYSYTHEVGVEVSLYWKDGDTWVDKSSLISNEKFRANAKGDWKFVYTATDGSGVSKEVPFTIEGLGKVKTESLLVAGENVSFASSREYDYIGGALKSSAMLATSTVATGTVTTKLIDLSTLTKDDYIFRWRPYSPMKDYQGVTMTTVKLIDAEDPTNYIQLNYTPNVNMLYKGNSMGAVSQWIYKNTSGEYVATGGVYEYGALMGTVNEIAYELGNFGGFGGVDITGDGVPEDWIGYGTGHIVQFYLAYENGMLYTPRKDWNTDNADFQSWVGFSGTKVYAELSWTNVTAGNGLAIDTIAGYDATDTYVQKDMPVFGENSDFTAIVDTDTEIPEANIYCYTHNVETDVALYYKSDNAWTDKTALISNGKFIPDAMGEWKFVYSTLDGSGLANEVPFTVVLKEIKGDVSDYQSVYFVEEQWNLMPFISNNMDDNEYIVSYTLTKDGNSVELFNNEITVSAEDIGKYVLTYTINSFRGATLTLTKNFEVCSYPTLESEYKLEEGQAISDIEFPFWHEGWAIRVTLYSATDLDKANGLMITNLALGEYVLDVEVVIAGRLTNVSLSTKVVVVERKEPIKPDDSFNGNNSSSGCMSVISGLSVGMTMLAAGSIILAKRKED